MKGEFVVGDRKTFEFDFSIRKKESNRTMEVITGSIGSDCELCLNVRPLRKKRKGQRLSINQFLKLKIDGKKITEMLYEGEEVRQNNSLEGNVHDNR